MFKKILVGSVLISGIIGTSIYFLSGWNTKKAPKTAADYLVWEKLSELKKDENDIDESTIESTPILKISN